MNGFRSGAFFLVTACFFAFFGCKHDEGLRSPTRRQWKDKAVAAIGETYRDSGGLTNELQRLAAIPASESDSDHWLSPKMILLKNGEWLVYTNKCRKEDGKIYDIFVARGSDGQWYYSTYHFCINMIVLRVDPQPSSISQFAQTYFCRTFDGRSDDCLQKTWPPKRQ